jgi:hypothetical protein
MLRPSKFLPSITLFLSASTLICCALPALFVALGAGAAFVSILGTFPQLVWFSEHKLVIFVVAGACIGLNLAMQFFGPKLCPTDPILAARCTQTRRRSRILLYTSTVLYLLGGFFAFVAPMIVG